MTWALAAMAVMPRPTAAGVLGIDADDRGVRAEIALESGDGLARRDREDQWLATA